MNILQPKELPQVDSALMGKTAQLYKFIFKRGNNIKFYFLSWFMAISSYPRLLLEVFLRKNFGQRYFNLASAFSVALIIYLLPLVIEDIYKHGDIGPIGIIFEYPLWYLLLAAFCVFSFFRNREVKRGPSSFDFGKFSYYSGDINPRFNQIKIKGIPVSTKAVETIFEPLVFFIPGVLLLFTGQIVGLLLIVSALAYSFSHMGAYMFGDEFVLDLIDQKIMSEELRDDFMNDRGNSPRGTRWYAQKPSTEELREEFLNMFIEEDEEVEAR